MSLAVMLASSALAQTRLVKVDMHKLLHDSGMTGSPLTAIFPLEIGDVSGWGNHFMSGGVDPAKLAVKIDPSLRDHLLLEFSGANLSAKFCGDRNYANSCRPVEAKRTANGYALLDGNDSFASLTLYASNPCKESAERCTLAVPSWGINPRTQELRNFPDRLYVMQTESNLTFFDPQSNTNIQSFPGFGSGQFGLLEKVIYSGQSRIVAISGIQALIIDFKTSSGGVFPDLAALRPFSDLHASESTKASFGVSDVSLIASGQIVFTTQKSKDIQIKDLSLPDHQTVLAASSNGNDSYVLLQATGKLQLVRINDLATQGTSLRSFVKQSTSPYFLSGGDLYIYEPKGLMFLNPATKKSEPTSILAALQLQPVSSRHFLVQEKSGGWAVYEKHQNNAASMIKSLEIPSKTRPFVSQSDNGISIAWIQGSQLLVHQFSQHK
jgi:hypothetical protein